MSKETEASRREFLKTLGYFIASSPLLIPVALSLKEEGKTEASEADVSQNKPLISGVPEEIESRNQLTKEPSKAPEEVETGIELLEDLGLRDKVVYIVYGRPYGWGSIGLTGKAEESWSFYHTRKKTISEKIGLNQKNFALNVINPAYYSQEHEAYYPLNDDYVKEALKLAPENHGLVALNFNRLDFAQEAISYLETIVPKESLAYLALGFDAEHFPNSQIDARDLNHFVPWFAQKHQEWTDGKNIPCLVFIYLFPASQILNMEKLKQYYFDEKALVVPIFDGWGLKGEKLSPMSGYIDTLSNTEASPALLGVMEAKSRHPNMRECSVEKSWETLAGTPAYFFASQ